jgi:hypothetical protein
VALEKLIKQLPEGHLQASRQSVSQQERASDMHAVVLLLV